MSPRRAYRESRREWLIRQDRCRCAERSFWRRGVSLKPAGGWHLLDKTGRSVVCPRGVLTVRIVANGLSDRIVVVALNGRFGGVVCPGGVQVDGTFWTHRWVAPFRPD